MRTDLSRVWLEHRKEGVGGPRRQPCVGKQVGFFTGLCREGCSLDGLFLAYWSLLRTGGG